MQRLAFLRPNLLGMEMEYRHYRAGESKLGVCGYDAQLMVPSETSARLAGLRAEQRGWVYCRHCGFFIWRLPD